MSLRTRFLTLRALRWFPTGLLLPVLVLYILDRGFTLAEIGLSMAAQAVVILALELPTGGLADVIGARRVLTIANLADLASFGLLLTADSVPTLVAVWAVQGLYRALESGPLDAWYVSAALATGDEPDIEADMARAGAVTGVSVATASLISSGLVALAPALGIEPLLFPLLVALALRAVDLVALWLLIEPADDRGGYGLRAGQALAEVPRVIAAALGLIRGSAVLGALLAVEVLWGFGLVGFESLFPPHLASALDDPDRAAALLGPVGTAAWLLSAVGSAAVPRLSKRLGSAVTGAVLRLAQGASVLAIAWLAGPVGLITAYLVTLGIHGAANAIHSAILHANTSSDRRTSVLSANSMAGHLGAGAGSIALGFVAAGPGIPVALTIAAVVLAAAAPLYLVGRADTTRSRSGA